MRRCAPEGALEVTEHRKAERFFRVGSHDIWPRTTHATADRLIRSAGDRVVGAAILAFDTDDILLDGILFDGIRQARPYVVLLLVLGLAAVRFDRTFAATGHDRRGLCLAHAQDETVLYASGAENTGGVVVASMTWPIPIRGGTVGFSKTETIQ